MSFWILKPFFSSQERFWPCVLNLFLVVSSACSAKNWATGVQSPSWRKAARYFKQTMKDQKVDFLRTSLQLLISLGSGPRVVQLFANAHSWKILCNGNTKKLVWNPHICWFLSSQRDRCSQLHAEVSPWGSSPKRPHAFCAALWTSLDNLDGHSHPLPTQKHASTHTHTHIHILIYNII